MLKTRGILMQINKPFKNDGTWNTLGNMGKGELLFRFYYKDLTIIVAHPTTNIIIDILPIIPESKTGNRPREVAAYIAGVYLNEKDT